MRSRQRDYLFILLLMLTSAAVRSIALLEPVFAGDQVMLQSVDPWIHYRRVEALTRDPGQDLSRDPYFRFPERTGIPVGPLLDQAVAGTARLLFGRNATERQIATVCAWLPPVCGSIIVPIVFLIGTTMATRRSAYIAAGLVSIGPGLLFYYSRLGAVDHHVLEVLLSTIVVLGLLRASGKSSAVEEQQSRSTAWKFLLVSMLAGVALACYLWTWIGGAYFVAVITLASFVTFCVRFTRGQTSSPIAAATLICLLTALTAVQLVPARYPLHGIQTASLLAAVVSTGVMLALAACCRRLRLPRWSVPAAMGTFCIAGGLYVANAYPQLYEQARWLASRLTPSATARTIVEVEPLFLRHGAYSIEPAWGMFATGLPLALIGLGLVTYVAIRRSETGYLFLMTWSLVGFVAMSGQNRFGYYVAVNIALLVGILVDRILSGINQSVTAWKRRLLAAWALGLVFVPALAILPDRAGQFDGPSPGWIDVLRKMRNETPEPFGDSTVYGFPSRAISPDDMENAYGVLAPWEAGYWVTGIARRTPVSNPTQAGAGLSGRFFCSSATEAHELLRHAGARYVLVDESLVARPLVKDADLGSTFHSRAAWAGLQLDLFYEEFEIQDDGTTAHYFHPAYFQSMAVRLYVFGGNAAEASRSMIIWYDDIKNPDGTSSKRVRKTHKADSYEDALKIMALESESETALVSDHPFQSCIPLQRLEDYRPTFDAGWQVLFTDGTTLPQVRAFEFLPAR